MAVGYRQSDFGPSTSFPVSPLAPAPAARPHLLGANLVENGVAFSVYAGQATAVELCLIEVRDGQRHEQRYSMHGPQMGLWHATIPGVGPGQHYGYRVYGPWDPDSGNLHNPQKLLLDPYARGIAGNVTLRPELYPHRVDRHLHPLGPTLELDPVDSLPFAPLGVVMGANFPIIPPPRVPQNRTVIYEAHVRGLTKNLPGIEPELAGTYAGLAHPRTIAYLKELGVTTLELLPIHAKLSEPFLSQRGLSNYWGYSTLGFFAPEPSYATQAAQQAGPQAVLDEVRGMVSLLHQAGIEVVLDVVYNHTCEGGQQGPALSWRGLDNTAYYLHDGGHPARYVDMTGCGNTLNFASNPVVGMALDSLRYWAQEVGIDGFRFDLAVTLGRHGAEYSQRHPFFVALLTDPVLGGCKMIAEPWDMGPGGWRTGQFPIPFSDWNDKYRDAVRSFWLRDAATLTHGMPASGPHELATRLAGSADMFSQGQLPTGRGPDASINFVAAHDGFTLADLVTYDRKHNEANGEDNRDGTDNNLSWNHGYEGPVLTRADLDASEFAAMVAPLRLRSMRNMWGTLLVSAGVPMFVAGDEFGRSQQGNNNAYCQDSEISYLDWDLAPWQEALSRTVRFLLRLRDLHPVMRPDQFATGRPPGSDDLPDLSWYDRHGKPLSPETWHDTSGRVMQMLRSGAPWGDNDLLVVFNGTTQNIEVNPPRARGRVFRMAWDSTWPDPENKSDDSHDDLDIPGYSRSVDYRLSTQLDPKFVAELGATPSYGIRLAEAISELPVTIHGMYSQMEALSMRIFFSSRPQNPTGDPKVDLMNVLRAMRD